MKIITLLIICIQIFGSRLRLKQDDKQVQQNSEDMSRLKRLDNVGHVQTYLKQNSPTSNKLMAKLQQLKETGQELDKHYKKDFEKELLVENTNTPNLEKQQHVYVNRFNKITNKQTENQKIQEQMQIPSWKSGSFFKNLN